MVVSCQGCCERDARIARVLRGCLLEEFATVRRLTVSDEGDEEVEMRVVYCRSCGRTLGTSLG